jgi:hypothetical protein
MYLALPTLTSLKTPEIKKVLEKQIHRREKVLAWGNCRDILSFKMKYLVITASCETGIV